MNYIITKHPEFFTKVEAFTYNFRSLERLATLPDEIAFDSETTGLHALVEDMFCVQIGTGTDNYLVHMYDDNFTFYDVIPYLKGKTLVMQNGLFDVGFMYKYNFTDFTLRDTMLATRVLYNGALEDYVTKKGIKVKIPVRADFGSIMKREIGAVYDKTTQKNIHIVKLSVATAIKYSLNDVDRLMEAHDVLLKKIEDAGQISTYLLHCRFIKALAYMEQCGLPINGESWQAKMKVDAANVITYSQEITDFIHEHAYQFADRQIDMFDEVKRTVLNFRSSSQMIPVFNSFGIDTKNKDGKDSIKEDIISKSHHPFVKIWLKYQEAQHRVSTFGQGVYDRIIDGRVYTNFNPMVDTARLSSRKGSINFLNFSSDKDTRGCFEAKRGNKMIVCDWAGQETVISADVSGDVAMTKSVVEGADLHCLLAKELFPEIADLSDEDIIEYHSDKRTKAKAPRFAMQYGGNGYTLHVNENIPLREAEEIYATFLNLHSGLFEWGRVQLNLAIRRGYIESADGWRLYLPRFDWFKDLKKKVDEISKDQWTLYKTGKSERNREKMIDEKNAKRKEGEDYIKFVTTNKDAFEYYKKTRQPISDYFSLRSSYQRLDLNNPVQTRGAHQMKLALCYMFEWIVSNDLMGTVLMCNAVHDETVCEAPEELSPLVRDKVGEFMRKAGNHYLDNLKIQADANIGNTWYEAK